MLIPDVFEHRIVSGAAASRRAKYSCLMPGSRDGLHEEFDGTNRLLGSYEVEKRPGLPSLSRIGQAVLRQRGDEFLRGRYPLRGAVRGTADDDGVLPAKANVAAMPGPIMPVPATARDERP